MASTSNAENFMKIARIVYQLCDYTDFRADFLQTRICGKWLVFANQVTYYVQFESKHAKFKTHLHISYSYYSIVHTHDCEFEIAKLMVAKLSTNC